ncbi:uncharacterized mitochondrial protein AtMg00310-like [Nicotiana tomentosiformis]|uniref:uncharacterized mitochondrial protein AtMg00310-like n=1 Tax=Nicotiana tomentosiformis TaxID=4098 RepID=UPI00388C88F6
MEPSKTIFKQIERYFTKCFWGSADGKQRYHWSSWGNMCYPKEEGGLGFRSMMDICESFAIKKWRRFRTCQSLWADFLMAKYCSRQHPCEKKWSKRQSHAWKKLLQARDREEENIVWNINKGAISLWSDNWTGLGALADKVMLEEHPDRRMIMESRVGGNGLLLN